MTPAERTELAQLEAQFQRTLDGRCVDPTPDPSFTRRLCYLKLVRERDDLADEIENAGFTKAAARVRGIEL